MHKVTARFFAKLGIFLAVTTMPAVLFAQDEVSPLAHPMASAPGSPFVVGGKDNEYLVDGISNRAFFALMAKWSTDTDRVTRVPVCWENPDSRHEQQRQLVKVAITNTWQAFSGILFQNWGTCTPEDTRAIRIAVGDFWPQSFIGRQVSGKPHGMKLNFDYNNPPEWKFCRGIADSCIFKTAVHEFGHAIGFMHEQARSDTPDQCMASQAGEGQVSVLATGYTTAGTPWDPDSVMNYCNPVWNNNGQLSSSDKVALQKIYGVPRK